MRRNPIEEFVDAPAGHVAVMQGNIAFAVGCARGGFHLADGYPGTPSTEVIDKALRHVQDRLRVGWSVNEAQAVGLAFGASMAGADALVTMKIPGLFQAADVIATAAAFTAERGALVLYIASDFAPTSTQYLVDPRYFLKSCSIPILEPRCHQEMLSFGPLAAEISREYSTPVAVLASGLLAHSEGLVRLTDRRVSPPLDPDPDFTRFMNLPSIARRNYDEIQTRRMPGLLSYSEGSPLNRIEWHDRGLGVVVHGMAEANLRDVWNDLPVKPSILSLALTYPSPMRLVSDFARELRRPPMVIGDGHRFVQEELLGLGFEVMGKEPFDPTTDWSPEILARRLGAAGVPATRAVRLNPPERPPSICAGCPYRAFGLVVERLRKKQKIAVSFGDIGCNTLLYFLKAIDTCACMGASDSQRQGAVLADPSLAGRSISVIGDSTECHSGMDSTRNALFRRLPGVKVVLDNAITAMTGGQPAPSSKENLAGEATSFDLIAALSGEGARVEPVDAFDLGAIEKALCEALDAAGKGDFTIIVLRGPCIRELPPALRAPRFEILTDRCTRCDQCLVCPGLERDEAGYPRFTALCSGCGGQQAVCVQRCKQGRIVPAESIVDVRVREEITSEIRGRRCAAAARREERGVAIATRATSNEVRRGCSGGRNPEVILSRALRTNDASRSRANQTDRASDVIVHDSTAGGDPKTAVSAPFQTMRVAARGVGGQGILFIGKVLAEVALLLGFERILKGETHGMAQLGGPVLSTFSCGEVHSPVLAPGTADVLLVLEMSEVLRPGFLPLLRHGGTILLNRLQILPAGVTSQDYPSLDRIREGLAGGSLIEFDALEETRAIGDHLGRTTNVVALGVLSTVAPFSLVPISVWSEALERVSSSQESSNANLAAFRQGRGPARRPSS